MRSLGIVTLLSVAATAAAPPPAKWAPLVTGKSSAAFVRCFARSQSQRSAAWWFAPKTNGGTFSNLGAPSVGKAYFLVVSDDGGARNILIEDVSPGSPQFEGVNQCI
jgi:hypothetical protein